MTAVLEDLALGVVLGFSLTVPPGPMNAWIAAAAARSFRAGVVTGLGAMTADAVLGAIVYAVDRFVDLDLIVRFVYLLGAGVMAFLGARLLRLPGAGVTSGPDDLRFLRSVLVGLSNPFQVVWWLTAGLAFAYLGGLVLFVGLFGAITVWILVFPWAIRTGARRDPRVERGVGLVSAALLLFFAAYFVLLFVTG